MSVALGLLDYVRPAHPVVLMSIVLFLMKKRTGDLRNKHFSRAPGSKAATR